MDEILTENTEGLVLLVLLDAAAVDHLHVPHHFIIVIGLQLDVIWHVARRQAHGSIFRVSDVQLVLQDALALHRHFPGLRGADDAWLSVVVHVLFLLLEPALRALLNDTFRFGLQRQVLRLQRELALLLYIEE